MLKFGRRTWLSSPDVNSKMERMEKRVELSEVIESQSETDTFDENGVNRYLRIKEFY